VRKKAFARRNKSAGNIEQGRTKKRRIARGGDGFKKYVDRKIISRKKRGEDSSGREEHINWGNAPKRGVGVD